MQLFFLLKVVRQNHTDMTSFRMQFENIGRGLLGEGFWSAGVTLPDNFPQKKLYTSHPKHVFLNFTYVNMKARKINNSNKLLICYLL